ERYVCLRGADYAAAVAERWQAGCKRDGKPAPVKLWRKIVMALLLAGFGLWCLTRWERAQALQAYGSAGDALVPAAAAEIEKRLDGALAELQRRHAGLAAIDRKYLKLPLEETQELLMTLAAAAF